MPTQPYLRGDKRKQIFLNSTPVSCSEHSVLFPNEELECCCGDKIKGEYYCFSYEENFEKKLYAGPFCGDRMIYLGNLLPPPLCDPFGLLPLRKNNVEGVNGIQSNSISLKENREMVRAITLLLFLWKNKEGYLSKIRNELYAHPEREVADCQIISLNKAIATTSKYRMQPEKTLRELVAIYGDSNGLKMKAIRFPVLEARIQRMGETSNL